MAAVHVSMKRTKDNRGPLEAAFDDPDVLRYKSIILRNLSQQFREDPTGIFVTEAEILCVTLLLFTSCIIGDEGAVHAHLLGLARMIRAFGGEDRLSPNGSIQIRFTSLIAAQLLQTRPLLSLRPSSQRRFENISAAPVIPQGISLFDHGLGLRFCTQPLSDALAPSLQCCVGYLRQVIARIEQVQDHLHRFNGDWIDEGLALKHVLVAMPHDLCLSPLDECVRLALLVYCNTAMWKILLYFRWVMALIRQLKSAIILLDQTDINNVPELHFWMLFLGRQACSVEFSDEETGWWTTETIKAAGNLGISSWDEARIVFLEFFYIDRISAQRWEAVWTDLVQSTLTADVIRTVWDPEHPCGYH